MVHKLLCNRPIDTPAAIDAAIEEQRVSRIFNAQRRREELIDVDIAEKQLTLVKRVENKLEIMAATLVQIAEQQSNYKKKTFYQNDKGPSPDTRGPNTNLKRRARFEFTADEKPICSYCIKINHIFRAKTTKKIQHIIDPLVAKVEHRKTRSTRGELPRPKCPGRVSKMRLTLERISAPFLLDIKHTIV